MVPESGGFRGPRTLADGLAGEPSRMRFTCHRCRRVRRTTQAVAFGLFAISVAVVLVLEKLKVL